jgi:hypothetical protein
MDLEWFKTDVNQERDIDMIVRVIYLQDVDRSTDELEKYDTYRLVVVNNKKEYYPVEYKSFHIRGFSIGDVLKIRSMGK